MRKSRGRGRTLVTISRHPEEAAFVGLSRSAIKTFIQGPYLRSKLGRKDGRLAWVLRGYFRRSDLVSGSAPANGETGDLIQSVCVFWLFHAHPGCVGEEGSQWMGDVAVARNKLCGT